MAWSDAARAAALAARRMHSSLRRSNRGRTSIIGAQAFNPKFRLQVARDLRAIRKGGGFKSYASKYAVHETAVISTNTRNAFRRKK